MSQIHEVGSSFDPTKKKKKKKVNVDIVPNSDSTVSDEVITGVPEETKSDDNSELDKPTEQDYSYEELLRRVYGGVTVKAKTAMKLSVPEVLRVGSKRTALVNFLDFCRTLHRSPEHLQAYMEAELASNTALDGQNRLVINGRFQVKNLESILRKYCSEYVLCYGCKSSNTVLAKENRLMFIRCEECGSEQTVAPIKRGFEAPIHRVRNAR